jgi:hypothetical protein
MLTAGMLMAGAGVAGKYFITWYKKGKDIKT